MSELASTLAAELSLSPAYVHNVLRLLADQHTVPFIARYRKELTGSMDEVALRTVRDRAAYLSELEGRRATILASIEAQGQLTPDLQRRIETAASKQALEDLYLPYRPKRRTRGMQARELGLEPLARALFLERLSDAAADAAVASFNAGRTAPLDVDAVWAGCRDILAEGVAEDAETRAWVRDFTRRTGSIAAAVTAQFATRKTKFGDYYAYEEALSQVPPHRYLALRRGETEKVLRVGVSVPEGDVLAYLLRRWAGDTQGRLREQWSLVLADAYRRLLAPAIGSELRAALKEAAEEASIANFSENLGHLLLQPPGGACVVLGLDPGLRTGSKWAVVDATGRVLEHGAIYPLPPQNRVGQSAQELTAVIQRHNVQVIAVGNGTASRELLRFVRDKVSGTGASGSQGSSGSSESSVRKNRKEHSVRAVLVSEAGASVYSASDIAREELPNLDVTVRGAVSIARRWQDPLSELVKIDPRSIGVGQYQHDVNQTRLRHALDETVEQCVNRVGVHVNTASWALLRYVSGLGAAQAKELVLHRDVRGAFPSREALRRVPRLGPKAFQQCAGFLRVPEGQHPLDASAVHPEHYALVERMAADVGVPLAALIGDEAQLRRIELSRYVSESVGLPTLADILAELRKPGRDPRQTAEAAVFDDQITEPAHLRAGMRLEGVVTNVTHFGAFVDVGVHQDGLVHVSQLADRFVRDPHEVVKVGQVVRVTVLSVDLALGRVSLSLKVNPDLAAAAALHAARSAQDGTPAPRPTRSAPPRHAAARAKKR